MAEPSPSGPRSPAAGAGKRLGALVAGWVGLALLAAAVTVLFGDDVPAVVSGWTVLGLWLAVVVTGVAYVRVVVHGSSEAITLSEVGVLPVILLLPPHLAILVGATAGLVAEAIITRGQLRKLLFNMAWQVVGLAAASWTFQALAGTGFAARPRPLVAALVAAAVYVVINLAAIAGVMAAASGRRWTTVVAEEAVSSLLFGYGTAQVGIVAAVLVVEAPWTLPLLAVPAVLYRGRAQARSEGLAGLAAERDRFQRTVGGTSDGVILLDPAGRVEVWNPAMAMLSGIAEERALGRTLQELGWVELARRGGSGSGVRAPEARVARADKTLSVRASRPARGDPDDRRTVLLVRDVSLETHLARLQEDLVTRVSHEIRTPLTTVMGLLETLDQHWGDLPPDRRHELVRVASRGALRLGWLISNLESLARIEARTGDGRPPVDQVAHVGAAVDEVVHSVQRSQVASVDIRGDPLVHVPAEDLRLILENLLRNAELYGAPPVEVAVAVEGEQVVLSVSDHGPGVPAELQSQLFEPFFQADGGLRRTAQGLGLGLAIVRSLAAASGGGVRHEERPGGGSRFTVTLPAATSEP